VPHLPRAKRARNRPCLLLRCTTKDSTPSARTIATNHFVSTLYPPLPVLYRPSSNIWLVLVASTRRLSTQRAGTRGFYSSLSVTLPSRYTATSYARAQAITHLLVHRALHTTTTTTTTLEHTPPPALLLLSAPPPPPDYRCLALLEHCTCHKPSSTHQHDTLLPQLSAITPRFLWHPQPIHVQVETDRHSIQAAF